MAPSISIILPTMGRFSLHNTLLSVVPDMAHGDELILLMDRTGDSGNTPRDNAMRRAKGSHLWFIDDDDIGKPLALDGMREAASEKPEALHCFKMEFGAGATSEVPGRVLWERMCIEPGNLGTPCVLVPNRPDLPSWTEGNDQMIFSDFQWIQKVAKLVPEVVWHSQIVALIRP